VVSYRGRWVLVSGRCCCTTVLFAMVLRTCSSQYICYFTIAFVSIKLDLMLKPINFVFLSGP